MAPSQFFLGKVVDPTTGKPIDQTLFYDPANLTTHGIITGMTGSGKTGLGVIVLEEAALQGIPAIIIDPKGDLTNLLLHFPDFNPADFEPWIDPEAARIAGQTVAETAAATAEKWKNGLADWGLSGDNLRQLAQSAHYSVFTPGSTAGLPVNILASFAAPDLPWDENKEILREKISTIVTALLSLIGLSDIDPLRSREHILLSNILESAWSSGRSLDMTSLIMQTQKPPFDRLGAFPLESFFPEKERFELALLLNNFLASPTFQTWIEGQPLDLAALQFGPDGRPRHSIFYLAHLSETERMFFVTLLFAAIESWMRSQRGTGSLRTLVYFDEIMGYMPPVANPPSRPVLLRMLKQARAFGVGLLLATQNPVDVDYKALSNAGTWMIGRLQTEQDKARLMDGLRSASGSVDLGAVDKIISGLGKRVFLLHSVHAKAPQIFTTRWTMNYLAGPLTRSQIPALNRMAGASAPLSPVEPAATAFSTSPVDTAAPAFAAAAPARSKPASLPGSDFPPAAPAGVQEVYFPANRALTEAGQSAGLLYRPALLAEAEIRYLQRKYQLDFSRRLTCLALDNPNGRIDWDNECRGDLESGSWLNQPQQGARFDPLPGWMSDARRWKALKDDFEDWLFRGGSIKLRANEELDLTASPDVSAEEFRQRCLAAAQTALQREQAEIQAAYNKKTSTLKQKVDKQELEVKELKDDLNARRIEEASTGLQNVLGLLGGRRRNLSSSVSKRRMTAKTGNQLEQAENTLKDLEEQLQSLEKEQQDAIQQAKARWDEAAARVTEVTIQPTRSNIFVEAFHLVWMPYYLVPEAGGHTAVPAYQLKD